MQKEKNELLYIFDKAKWQGEKLRKKLYWLIKKNNDKALKDANRRVKIIQSKLLHNPSKWLSRSAIPTRTIKIFRHNKSGKAVYLRAKLKSKSLTSKNFVSVRTRFYKANQGQSLEKHISREVSRSYDARNTASVCPEFMKDNLHYRFRTIADCDQQYQYQTGKKPRNDFRKAYENVVVFSEDRFVELERQYGISAAKIMLMEHIKYFALMVREKYGFEPVRVDLHLDEGFVEPSTGLFRRNVHCHLLYYNYDFKNAYSPLAKMLKKHRCPDTGKLQPNPAMSDLQDLSETVFSPLGFKRGVKKHISQKSHLSRDEYIASQHKQKVEALRSLDRDFSDKKNRLERIVEQAHQQQVELSDKQNKLDTLDGQLGDTVYRQKITQQALDLTTDCLTAIMDWKKHIVNQEFDEIGTAFNKVRVAFDNLKNCDAGRFDSLSETINKLLNEEIKQLDRFENKYYVIPEQRVSGLKPKL
ncbi:hypothetical protein [Idiomarina sp.]|uniref:hypothetical protein n=1 Tax=Idiomarina sp. TaxID=1874361 RepID=UPI0025C1EA11|nr:hypothetical protein [Idiomarina sp.]